MINKFSNLQAHTRGWHSQRFCTYPQEIVIGFPCKVHLKNIDICFHEQKVPSKVEIYQMNSVDDELFGSSSTMNTLDISQRYPKLPKKQSKELEERSEIKEEDQSSPPIKLKSTEESKDGESLSTTTQSREHRESKKLETKNIHDNLQKGEALKEKQVYRRVFCSNLLLVYLTHLIPVSHDRERTI